MPMSHHSKQISNIYFAYKSSTLVLIKYTFWCVIITNKRFIYKIGSVFFVNFCKMQSVHIWYLVYVANFYITQNVYHMR